jgi:hypothetical protein
MSQMMQGQQPPAESVVVNGAVEGVEVKPNGRFVVKVRDPQSSSQYAASLNTKDQEIAQQMMNAVGQSFSFLCGLSHWVNNGQPVTSKWINGVAAMQGGAPQNQTFAPPQFQQQPQQFAGGSQGGFPQSPSPAFPQPAAPAPSPVASGGWGPDTIRRVCWLGALGPAVEALAYLPEEQRSVASLVKMTDFLAKTAIARGEQGFAAEVPMQQQAPQQQYQGDPGPGIPATDDGVPY